MIRADEGQLTLAQGIRSALIAMIGSTGFAVSAPVLAQSSCTVELTPTNAPQSWHQAKKDIELMLARWKDRHDCRLIKIIVRENEGASLSYQTVDDRITTRQIEYPSEAVPTLQALLITSSPGGPTKAGEPTKTEGPTKNEPETTKSSIEPGISGDQPKTAPAKDRSTQSATEARSRLILGLAFGNRFAIGNTSYAGPSIRLNPSLVIGNWLLGIGAESTPIYDVITETPPNGFVMRTWTFSADVQRKQDFEKVGLRYGIWAGVSIQNESASGITAAGVQKHLQAIQPHVGAIARLVYPSSARARIGVELNTDITLAQWRQNAAEQRGLPPFAPFSAVLALCVESTLL